MEKSLEEKVLDKIVEKAEIEVACDKIRKKSKVDKKKYVYFIQEITSKFIKIGFAASVASRKAIIQSSNPHEVIILGIMEGGAKEEAIIHEQFSHLRIRGEWYKSNEDLLNFIKHNSITGPIPVNLNKKVLQFNDKKTKAGEECKDLIKLADAAKMDDSENEELISIDTAAAMLGVSKQTVRNWEEKGRIIAERSTGNHRRYKKTAIFDFKKQQMGGFEFVISDITPTILLNYTKLFLSNFDLTENITITARQDSVNEKMILSIDSLDKLNTFTKSFNIMP